MEPLPQAQESAAPFETHRVDNQPPPFGPRDLWRDDAVLRDALARELSLLQPQPEPGSVEEGRQAIASYAVLAGGPALEWADDAHRDRPRLLSHDRFGHRIDRVAFHPAYHSLMDAAIRHGVAGWSWRHEQPGGHVVRAALSYLHHQVEPGTSCPLTMTHAAVPVLRREPALAQWAEKAAAPLYDPREVPVADKAGVTIGMGMTEKQGGSDVRANTTVATALADGSGYRLVGHKWFLSAPMSDGFLMLAQAPGGLGCFLMPRVLEDGSKNAFRLIRLKDKLGDWSNASSEIELCGALAFPVGAEGRGVATILEMVMLTRLDCLLGGAAQMRMALARAIHHCRHRHAFGKRLLGQPLMANVLADLAVEAEAALVLAMRIARAVDAAERDPAEAALARIGTAVGKYWVCRRAPAFVNEAQECLGGNGYIEESLMPRLYRQAPLNSIWEGSGNIQCLDVLRALQREPDTGAAVWAELVAAGEGGSEYAQAIEHLRAALTEGAAVEPAQARGFVERLALALQASLLLRAGSPAAQAFCRSRLGGEHGLAMGTLPAGVPMDALIERALPAGISTSG
ncbi:acyl-CoA dehydrogenase family protein [Lysobacter sp. H21R4]|uniref:acyl-CoA dehydrogenase family protein n=1 Tax=Lysobacter sp. H21R4 TaxID=2781021 RepID=UPI001888EA9D|nr:acyl-CoA dehydrogenase family protein [Lysobacter sp. H21R4]QOY62118.1 acyl-CoA dehydrogenase family protein [Lysobacter sp. H21R4]